MIHATINGRVTLCSKPVPKQPLTLDSTTAPRNGKSVCKFCKQAEEEGRRYQ
ncbi:MAG: hypothetical protein ACLP9L_28285 [Thermoguttaceae bacterium]